MYCTLKIFIMKVDFRIIKFSVTNFVAEILSSITRYYIVGNSWFFEIQMKHSFINKTTSFLNPSIAHCCPVEPIMTDFN